MGKRSTGVGEAHQAAVILALELADLKLSDMDLGLLGFDDAELASLLGLPKGLTDPDDISGGAGKHRLPYSTRTICGVA